jgi:diguanylate cyclase (GGDEF)-like protein/PAS domain S-box-containing protein
VKQAIAGDAPRRAPPRVVNLLDARQGPLAGAGRLLRVAPFAITGTISMLVAVPTSSWSRPSFAVAGTLGVAVAIIAALVAPWHRLARTLQLGPPVLFLAAMVLMVAATHKSDDSPFLTMSVLPLMWLALYEGRALLVSIATMTGVALWLLVPSGAVNPSTHATPSIVVFLVCAAGMGVTLNTLVADTRRLAHALRDERAALESAAIMLDALPEHVSRYRLPDHAITYCNAAWAAQYHVAPAEAIGHPLDEFLSDDEMIGLRRQLTLLGPETPILEDSIERAGADDSGTWIHWIDQYLADGEGAEILSIGRDVTERHHAEAALAASEVRYRALADKSADVVWHFTLDPTPHFDYMSPSVEKILGYPPSYFLEDFSRMLAILDEASTTAIQRAINGERVLERFDFRFRHADGSIVIGETRTTLTRRGLQGVSRDVTELRRLQSSVAALALRDPLTGLANRRLLDELLDVDLARTQRNERPLAVAFLDLDDFKRVNDTYGHKAGDIVLCETARRLSELLRGADTIARVGGDEFVFMFEPNTPDSQHLIDRVNRALCMPIVIDPSTTVCCPASIGIADTSTTGYNRDALLAAADHAMYETKRARKSHRLEASPSQVDRNG